LKIFFCLYLRQKWIDLRQSKAKMINGPFYTYRRIHFAGGNASHFVIFVSNYPGGHRSGHLLVLRAHRAVNSDVWASWYYITHNHCNCQSANINIALESNTSPLTGRHLSNHVICILPTTTDDIVATFTHTQYSPRPFAQVTIKLTERLTD